MEPTPWCPWWFTEARFSRGWWRGRWLLLLGGILGLTGGTPAEARSWLSVDLGVQSAGLAVGTPFWGGVLQLGLAGIFVDQKPWSYVGTREGLGGPCGAYNQDPVITDPQTGKKLARRCEPQGQFHDGDEWEVFFRWSWGPRSLPVFTLDVGGGLAYHRWVTLYIFCKAFRDTPLDQCSQAQTFETWGEVQERYLPTGLIGLGWIVGKGRLYLNYHSRRGILMGWTWRFP